MTTITDQSEFCTYTCMYIYINSLLAPFLKSCQIYSIQHTENLCYHFENSMRNDFSEPNWYITMLVHGYEKHNYLKETYEST